MWASGVDKARAPGFYFWPRFCLLPDLGLALAEPRFLSLGNRNKSLCPFAPGRPRRFKRSLQRASPCVVLLRPPTVFRVMTNNPEWMPGSRVPGVWRPSHPALVLWGKGMV